MENESRDVPRSGNTVSQGQEGSAEEATPPVPDRAGEV